jgi:predicted nucleic acid-binding protein
MVVVADSSPLIVLIKIGHVSVLRELFRQVVIPPEVTCELQNSSRPQSVRDFMEHRPAWIVEQSPSTVEPIASLHAGELAAISLAQELKADLLIIDEALGRKAAAERHIPFTGTIGVLELAASRSLLDLATAFEQVKKTDFWISHELLDHRLKMHNARRGSAS